ncbi:hypothetical protein W02_20770 [Nitrospira sp. KM1]|uniref:hypothetical protein n=1 Tax=Nitrospira sp. KM1 TaxID=1936990 RepID=UPI0013A79534|nr:hypothetical protein [Nitrospira sp. KM1]BCA54937.1 hypothetical protein W02_20770 [Nitrospira sp. KM1]
MTSKLRDLTRLEWAALLPLAVPVFAIEVYPNPILTRMHASVEKVLARSLSDQPQAGAPLDKTADVPVVHSPATD